MIKIVTREGIFMNIQWWKIFLFMYLVLMVHDCSRYMIEDAIGVHECRK